jgi:hypothetical protein
MYRQMKKDELEAKKLKGGHSTTRTGRKTVTDRSATNKEKEKEEAIMRVVIRD